MSVRIFYLGEHKIKLLQRQTDGQTVFHRRQPLLVSILSRIFSKKEFMTTMPCNCLMRLASVSEIATYKRKLRFFV